MHPESSHHNPRCNWRGGFLRAARLTLASSVSLPRLSLDIPTNWYVVRFWKDVAGQEKRQRVREKICPISGPGKLSASGRKHKAKEIIAASGANTAEHFENVVRSNHGITFREQAEIWLK